MQTKNTNYKIFKYLVIIERKKKKKYTNYDNFCISRNRDAPMFNNYWRSHFQKIKCQNTRSNFHVLAKQTRQCFYRYR